MLTEQELIWIRMALDRQALALNHALLAFKLNNTEQQRSSFISLFTELLENNQGLRAVIMQAL